ncbi:DUF7221 family queuine tRNA-ribosyltransferase-like protein [Longimicrobium sp.]|uniref:deazapurine DNA modification protein DpdA family protein n=1 Tax=Longimicrobium sp. TaxID=2029185 RepID=UPI003BEEE9F2
MVSANSFFRRDADHEVVAVRRPGRDLDGLDAALDSSGYVAMRHYGGYSWALEAYVLRVVAAFPWAWYAAPDYSCEPQVAGSSSAVRFRQAATVALYTACTRVAEYGGLPGPVPVLQGWWPEDYHRCWDMLALPDAPSLLGVGSVCARQVHGPDGLMAVLERLDRVLPTTVQLHLFGVKSDGIEALVRECALDGRVRSVDSMAWDVEARARFRTGRTIARRARVMHEWYTAQRARAIRAASAAQHGLPRTCFPPPPAPGGSGDELLDYWVELVAGGEIDLLSAHNLYEQERFASASSFRPVRQPHLPGPRLHSPKRVREPSSQATLPLPVSLAQAA